MQDNSTFNDPVTPGRRRYIKVVDTNYNAVLNASLLLEDDQSDATTVNISASMYAQGFFDYPTVSIGYTFGAVGNRPDVGTKQY